jgi:hypothetical protein
LSRLSGKPLLVVWWLRGRVPRANAALVGSARECLRIPCERTVLQPPGFGSISPRSRPRFAKPRARDRSEEPLIPSLARRALPLTLLCRDRADALRCPSSFRIIARRFLRARSHLRPPRLATRPCRLGPLLRATRTPSVVSIRDALRGTSLPVTSLRSCRVGVARMRNPVSRRSLLSPLPRSVSFEIGSSTALSNRSSPVRAPSRLDRARAPRGTRAAAIPVRSTDICNPQDLFSTTSPTVSVRSESCSHAIREPPVQRRQPASAVRALPFSSSALRGTSSALRRTAYL